MRGRTPRTSRRLTGRPAEEPIRIYTGTSSADSTRGPGAAGGRRPRAGRRLRPRRRCSWSPRPGPAGSSRARRAASSTSPAATPRSSRCSTPTCRRGCPTWSTTPRPGWPGATCSTRSTTGGPGCRPTRRPKLYVFGESLGSFGGENAFSGEADLANRTDGALFVGPPSFNPLYREFVDARDDGQPRDRAGLPGRPDHPLRQPGQREHPARGPAVDRTPASSTSSSPRTRSPGGAPT